jgi:prepilin-type N-terminal cleavage/methylation domain-containing protein/prepilin-type processing-associated H-X9-DG protein
MNRRAFTLIETLVTVAIIGVLAALTLTGLRSVRSRAQSVVAQNNMRQIYLAASLFANDHNGSLPKVAATGTPGNPEEFFFLMSANGVADLAGSGLTPYLGSTSNAGGKSNVFFAPGDDGIKEDGTPGRNFSFSFNFLINKGELPEGATEPSGFEKALGTIRLLHIARSSEKILIYEEDRPNDALCVWGFDRPTKRYNGKANVVFADGHASLMPGKDVLGEWTDSTKQYGELVTPDQQH